jgi:hypothetical protein
VKISESVGKRCFHGERAESRERRVLIRVWDRGGSEFGEKEMGISEWGGAKKGRKTGRGVGKKWEFEEG